MIKIPIDEIISRIKKEKGLSEEEIKQKIDQKLTDLSGLISREGAAHIIANELGIKLFEQSAGLMKIAKIFPGMRNVETAGRILALYELRQFQRGEGTGKVRSFLIGDETGRIRVVAWGSQTDNLNDAKEGDTIRLKNSYLKDNQGRKEIHLNDNSMINLNPEGIVIEEVAAAASAARKKIGDLQESDSNAELLGTLLQTFEPRFFEVCPQCKSRTRSTDNVFTCRQHGDITPDYSYVLNFFLDDGSGNIRVVCFGEQVEQLLNCSHSDVLLYKDDPQKFEPRKTELLGNIVKVNGRVTKNTFFDRLEFTSSSIKLNPDPQDEIQRLEKDDAASQQEEVLPAVEAAKQGDDA